MKKNCLVLAVLLLLMMPTLIGCNPDNSSDYSREYSDNEVLWSEL